MLEFGVKRCVSYMYACEGFLLCNIELSVNVCNVIRMKCISSHPINVFLGINTFMFDVSKVKSVVTFLNHRVFRVSLDLQLVS